MKNEKNWHLRISPDKKINEKYWQLEVSPDEKGKELAVRGKPR